MKVIGLMDSSRTAMAVKQFKHTIPVKKSSPVLISNGAEQTIHHHLSHDFAVVAKHDGVVKEVDEKTGIVVIEYKNGTKEAFDVSPKIAKNGNCIALNSGDTIQELF